MKFSKSGLIFRGLAMGIAEVIPGVSGGTIAFITGIYKTLIDSIKSIDHKLIGSLLKFDLKAVWTQVNGNFLLWLITGMVIGILGGVFGVSYLLEQYPEVLWGLFFGLILASVSFMFSQIENRGLSSFILLAIGAGIAYGVTSIPPSAGSTDLLYVFMAGAIAISALVLPGISGSFMLLIMGLYTTIIPTVRAFLSSPELNEFVLLGVFAMGCLTGLLVFSRLVSAAFEKYHDGTIALLSGFMLGSLNKIWPWRNPITLLDKETGQFQNLSFSELSAIDFNSEALKIVKESNVLPGSYFSDPMTLWVILSGILGLALVYLLSRADFS